VSDSRPWEVGDHESRWLGYLIAPDSPVLRNKIGATTAEDLRVAENDLVEARVVELRSRPGLVKRTYDLAHLRALHFQLFQDVYEWAGDIRTVGIAKGDGDENSFIPPLDIERPVAHVASRIAESDLLRTWSGDVLIDEVTYLYDYLHFAHPFREGNGRTQREFFAQLLAESGRGLAWIDIEMTDLHSACHAARTEGDIAPLRAIITAVLTDDPVY
jgi:cell filamentation protein